MFLPISILDEARKIAADDASIARFGLDFSQGGIHLVVTTLSESNSDGVEIGRKLLNVESLRESEKIWIPREKLSNIEVTLKSDRNQRDEKYNRASGGDRGVSDGEADRRGDEQPVRLGGGDDQQRGGGSIDQEIDGVSGSNAAITEAVDRGQTGSGDSRDTVSVSDQGGDAQSTVILGSPDGSSTQDSVDQPPAELAVVENKEADDRPEIGDSDTGLDSAQFELTEDVLAEYRGPKQKARDNVAALRLIKDLNDKPSDHSLTLDQKTTLARYVGWGGLPDAFRGITGETKDTWGDIVADIESILSEKEIASARRTTLDAHYTSKDVVDIIYAGVKATGIQPRKISEPSVGTGNFIGLSPFDRSLFTAVEIDGVTASIAKRLYPEANVIHSGFQNTEHGDGSFYDLVVGNPPFGSTRIIDQSSERLTKESPNTHTYFFNKSMSRLAPGGVMAMVVSRYLMDSDASQPFRERIAKQANLVAAIRLPGDAFKENAGTSVVTDILFLQKRHEMLTDDDEMPSWVESVNIDLPVHKKTGETLSVKVNAYYANRMDRVMGETMVGRGMYRDNELMVFPVEKWKDRAMSFVSGIQPLVDLPDQNRPLVEIKARNIDETIPSYFGREPPGAYILVPNENNHINGLGDVILGFRYGVTSTSGAAPYRPVIESTLDDDIDETLTADLKKSSADRLRLYIPIRDSMTRLIGLQVSALSSDVKIENERKVLGGAYDEFVKRFGLLNRAFNTNAIKNDPFSYQVLTLERNYQKAVSAATSLKTGEEIRPESAKKSPIFTTRTQFPPPPAPDSAKTAKDALVISMNAKGRVDTGYIESLMKGRPWSEIRQELGGSVMFTEKGWEVRESVIHGDIVSRMDVIRHSGIDAIDQDETNLTMKALKESLPKRKTVEDGEVNPLHGAQWIPIEITREFIDTSFGANSVQIMPISETGAWDVKQGVSRGSGSFATERVTSVQMARLFLHRHIPEVFDNAVDENGNDRRVLNEGQTEVARSKMDSLLESWDKWILDDPNRSSLIEDAFNLKFNRFAAYSSFGDNLTLPGKSDRIDLRPTQKDGVWRMIQQQATLLDHAVGAGKTFTAIAGVMELKRIGLVNKAIITMPNGLEGQWAEAISDLYPSARVIVPSKKDMSARNRQGFLARIAVDDQIDIVLMPHSSFSLIPRDMEFEENFIEEQVLMLRRALASAATFASSGGGGGRSHTTKAIEKKIASKEAKLQKILARSASGDSGINFSQLGVDLLIVDESQQFKNVSYQTTLSGVGGLGNPDGSAKADDCMIKSRSILESGGRVVDMSGTPEANTLAEVYLSQYKLSHKTLEDMGIHSFDQWASVFAKVSYEFQPTLSGGYKERAYLNEFVNMSTLRETLSYRHSVTIEDVQRLAIESGMPPMDLPKLEGGKPQVVVCPKTDLQERLIGYQVGIDPLTGDPEYNEGSILHQIDNLPSGRPRKGEKNILTCIGDLSKVGLSANAYLSKSPNDNERSPKLDAAAHEIMKDYHRWESDKGTQVVFLDFSTPKTERKGKQSEESIAIRGWLADIEKGESGNATDDMLSRRDAAEESLSGYTESEIEDILSDGKEWSAYRSLRELLIEQGMKPQEIAFVHDYENPVKREELFGMARSGQIRVIIGSTSKMGAGVNIQERMVTMHMLDAPWRPDQMIQRIGRMLRQGNLLLKKYGDEFTVRLKYYVTDGSADSARFQVLENKKKFLDQVRVNGGNSATDATFNPSEISAACSGNPILQDKAEIKSSLKKAQAAFSARQQDDSRQSHRERTRKERMGYLDSVAGDVGEIITVCGEAAEQIKSLRTKHDKEVADVRSVIDGIREVHRENVRLEKERIKVEFKAEGKSEKDVRSEIALKQVEWDENLSKKLADVPKSPAGWIAFNDRNGNPLKNLTVSDFGINLIDMSGDMRRGSKSSEIAFSVGDIEVRMKRVHSELSGTSIRLEAAVVAEDGHHLAVTWSRSMATDNAVSAGMTAIGMISGLMATAKDVESERQELKEAMSIPIAHDGWDRVGAMAAIDFLKGTHDAAQNMLRCGLKDWDEGDMAYRIISGLPFNSTEAKTNRVHTIITGPMNQLAIDVLPESIGFIRSWIENRDAIRGAMTSSKPIPVELIRSVSVMACDVNWSLPGNDKKVVDPSVDVL